MENLVRNMDIETDMEAAREWMGVAMVEAQLGVGRGDTSVMMGFSGSRVVSGRGGTN